MLVNLDYVPSVIYATLHFIGGIVIFGIQIPPECERAGDHCDSDILGLVVLTGVSMIEAGMLLPLRSPYGVDPLTQLIALLTNIMSGVYFPV